MEPNQTRKILIVIGVVLAAGIAVFAYRRATPPPRTGEPISLSRFVPADLPILELDLRFHDIRGDESPPSPSRLTDGTAPEPAPPPEGCPVLTGGDTDDVTVIDSSDPLPENCPKKALWHVTRHPVAFSLYFQDAPRILSALANDPEIRKIYESRLIQGVFYELIHSLSARAEDLKLEGLQGAFLRQLITEALSAHGELHYDAAHGSSGFVFSFIGGECRFAGTALPVMARYLARNGYKIPKLPEPILEMKVGVMRCFMTRYENRIYLANGLESLLNVIDRLDAPEALPKTPLALTVRGQAFLDKILQVVVGQPRWEATLGIDFSKASPGELLITSGKYEARLRPKIFKGVLAGIPHDAFGAVAASFHLPPDMTAAQWKDLTTRGPGPGAPGPEESGIAVIWDLNADTRGISEIGVAIANPGAPDQAGKFTDYFARPELTAACGGGTVFLAASSPSLLNRMKDACERQSLSILDWERGGRAKEYDAARIVMFLNPGAGMRELFLAGGAKGGQLDDFEFEPQWKRDYETARNRMRRDAEQVCSGLPVLAFRGGALSSGMIRLQGFTITQGESK